MKKIITPPKIEVTFDYYKFSFIESNRPIRNTKKLEMSIKEECDLTPYVPIIVDARYRILDGHHRFMACKNIGLPIYYVVCAKDSTVAMILLNKGQKTWRQEEFLKFHATTKGGCYADLYEFYIKHNIGISNSIVVYP